MRLSLLLAALACAAGAEEMHPWARVFLHHAPPKGGFTRVLLVVYVNRAAGSREPIQDVARYVDVSNRRMREETYPSAGRRGFPSASLYNGDNQYDVHPMDPYFIDHSGNTPSGELPWQRPDWGRRAGSARVLNRPCDVYEQSSPGFFRRVCVWRGLALREETSDHVLEAVHIDERAVVPEFIMDARRLSRLEYPTGNPHDLCRVDTLEGENINRYAFFQRELCLERVCEEFGPPNAARGTASVCLFHDKPIAEYGTEGMEPRKVAAAKAWIRLLAARKAGRAADARKAAADCLRADPESERCKGASRPARLRTLPSLTR